MMPIVLMLILIMAISGLAKAARNTNYFFSDFL